MHEDLLTAVNEILEGAKRRGIILRVLGGAAVRLRCPSATHRALDRKVPDIDLIAYKKHSKEVSALLTELGLEPVKMFNALHGDRRLLFTDPEHGRQVDVFLDIFEMCHRFDFRKRMLVDDRTLPLADLLVTKLQIIEINEKDYKDIISMLLDHPIGEKDEGDCINAAYIASLCSDDWGVYRTLTRNLDWTKSFVREMDLEEEKKQVVMARIDQLLQRIESEPKSLKWRMRAKIGDRMVWYDTPERVGKITTGQ